MRISAGLRRRLELGPKVLDAARRDFAPAGGETGRRLDAVVESFAHGYNAALNGGYDPAALPHALRGFGYEGAAMSTALLDLMSFSGGRGLHALASGDGARYVHLINVGAGWAFARMRLRPWLGMRPGPGRPKPGEHGVAAPLLRWLAWDGWGFHQAFFGPAKVYGEHRAGPMRVRRVCDQGAGRALWFYAGADPDRIAHVIGTFPVTRHSDLWAGIGLAAAYTGAAPADAVAALPVLAHDLRGHVAQGAAFAAKAHLLTGEVPADCARTIETLTGVLPAVAAGWTDRALARSAAGPDTPTGYEGWRAGIRRAWTQERQMV